jgi:hypothetical protein
VLGEVWIRSVAIAAAGGGVIGLVGFPTTVWIRDSSGLSTEYIPLAIIAATAGVFVGLALGGLAGFLLGVVGACSLVPYRGVAANKWTMRLGATALAAGWFPFLTWGNVYGDASVGGLVGIFVPSLAGAWWLGPKVITWYDRLANDELR